MTVIGVTMGGMTLFDAILPHREDPNEYEKLTSAIAFFRGFQLLFISIVGEYVGRIYLILNNDPQYVIRERLLAGKKNARELAAGIELQRRRTGDEA